MTSHVKFFRKIQNLQPDIREALLTLLEEIEQTVTKKEFNELKEVVQELSNNIQKLSENIQELWKIHKEFEKETRENFNRVWQAIDELREAQKRTEQRVNELAEAQKRTEQRVNELAEAQKRTEQRLNELADAQKRTEERLNQLADAQKKTEEELKKLIGEHKKTREMVGGLSHTVGYILEDRAYKGLPELIKRDFGILTTEPLKRKFIKINSKKYIEINIIGKGKKGEKEYLIIGECKTQLKKKDVDRFLKTYEKLKNKFPEEKKVIFVTYQTSPEVESYIKENNLKLYYSYELPL